MNRPFTDKEVRAIMDATFPRPRDAGGAFIGLRLYDTIAQESELLHCCGDKTVAVPETQEPGA